MISSFLAQINLNLSNMTYEIMRYSVEPYINIFGNFFWGIFFGFIGASIYGAGAGDSRIYIVLMSYLVGVGIIFSIILDNATIAIFGLLLAFLVSAILYKVFVEPKS